MLFWTVVIVRVCCCFACGRALWLLDQTDLGSLRHPSLHWAAHVQFSTACKQRKNQVSSLVLDFSLFPPCRQTMVLSIQFTVYIFVLLRRSIYFPKGWYYISDKIFYLKYCWTLSGKQFRKIRIAYIGPF